jgi:hypothetical protein
MYEDVRADGDFYGQQAASTVRSKQRRKGRRELEAEVNEGLADERNRQAPPEAKTPHAP